MRLLASTLSILSLTACTTETHSFATVSSYGVWAAAATTSEVSLTSAEDESCPSGMQRDARCVADCSASASNECLSHCPCVYTSDGSGGEEPAGEEPVGEEHVTSLSTGVDAQTAYRAANLFAAQTISAHTTYINIIGPDRQIIGPDNSISGGTHTTPSGTTITDTTRIAIDSKYYPTYRSQVIALRKALVSATSDGRHYTVEAFFAR